MLARQDGSVRDIPLPGLQAELAGLEYSAAKFDLTLDLADTGEGISGTLNFATALFDRATAERYGVYVQALRAMTLNNPRSVSHIDLLPLAEREHLHGWNRTERDYPLDQTTAALFEQQVRRTPGHRAGERSGKPELRPAERPRQPAGARADSARRRRTAGWRCAPNAA